jgi:hypothetical protein
MKLPWTATYDELGGYDCMTAAWHIVDADGTWVCLVDLSYYGQRPNETPSPEAQDRAAAAARLIVGAPELLELLQAIWNRDTLDLSRIPALLTRIQGDPR